MQEFSSHPAAIKAREWRAKNPSRAALIARRKNLKHKYGLSLDGYDSLLAEQDRCCAICGIHEEQTPWPHKLVIDHCHHTKEVRGLLCSSCNRGIGLLQDSPKLLLNAADYLAERTKVK